MKYQKLVDEVWADVSFVTSLFSSMITGLFDVWVKDKMKFILTLLALIVIFVLSILFSKLVWGQQTQIQPVKKVEIAKVSEGTGSENAVNIQVQANLVFVESIVNVFSPLLNNFVATTPDVAGKLENQINFSFGSMKPASHYSNQLTQITFPILVLLLSWQVVSLLFYAKDERSREDLSSLLKRLLVVIIMFIFTPYILSYSIGFTNGLNQYILGNEQISGYLKSFFDQIKLNYKVEGGVFGLAKGLWDNLSSGLNPAQNLANTLQLILVLTPVYISLLIFLFIIFQFVIRFLKLYFLAVVYPFIIIFYLNKNSQITTNFWKEWTTSLVHQTGFIMGYKIINDLVLDVLKTGGVGLEQLLIYIGGLLFLLSINVITGQLWGNAFSAISDSFMAKSLGSLVSAPFSATAGAVAGFGAGAIGVPTRNSLSGFAGSRIREKMMGKQSGSNGFVSKKYNSGSNSNSSFGSKALALNSGNKGSDMELKDPTKSKSAQRMSSNGYDVTGVSQKEGVIGVSGTWQAYDNPQSGITSLYENKQDALRDGVRNPEKLYPVSGNYNMLDTVNYLGMKNYAQRTGIKPLPDNSPNKLVNQTLNDLKADNLKNNISGITTSQYPREVMEKFGGKPPKDTPRIQKGFVYTDSVKNSKK